MISRADIQRHFDLYKAQEMDKYGLKATLCLREQPSYN